MARVDLAYPARRLLIEVDSKEHHAEDGDRLKDLARRNRLTAIGFTVMHVTHTRRREDVRAIAWWLASMGY